MRNSCRHTGTTFKGMFVLSEWPVMFQLLRSTGIPTACEALHDFDSRISLRLHIVVFYLVRNALPPLNSNACMQFFMCLSAQMSLTPSRQKSRLACFYFLHFWLALSKQHGFKQFLQIEWSKMIECHALCFSLLCLRTLDIAFMLCLSSVPPAVPWNSLRALLIALLIRLLLHLNIFRMPADVGILF